MGNDPNINYTRGELAQLAVHNAFYEFTFDVLLAACRSQSKALIGFENPAARTGTSSMFNTKRAIEMRKYHNASDYVFHKCEYGLAFVKATQLLTNAAMMDLNKLCSHGPNAHPRCRAMTETETL